MLRKLFAFLIVLGFCSFVYHISAQEVLQPQNRNCLKATQVGGQTTVPPPEGGQLQLTGNGFPDNQKVDIEFCQPSDNKTQCDVVGQTVAKGGAVDTIVPFGAGLQGHVNYAYYGVYTPEPTQEMGGAGGQQQSTITFVNDQANCTSIEWDPFGRVFDSQSLEPFPNIGVSVLDNLSPVKLTQTRNNPQTTIADGAFNFLVKAGTYFLKVNGLTVNPKLNPNYIKAYSSIYKPDEPIIEKPGKPEHRDIPLDPGNNPPSHFPVVNIPGSYDQMVFGSATKYGGKISHPFSIVALVGQKSKKEVTRVTADKFGFWTVLINNKMIPQDEPLVTKLIKVDLTTGKADEKNARIMNDPVFDPILRNLQGYVNPNVKVSIILDGTNKIFSQTTADSNGYFKIATANLPVLPYHINKVSTSTFAQNNSSYLNTNKINLMSSSSDTKTVISNYPPQANVTQTVNQTSNNNTLPIVIALVIFFMAVASLGFYLFMKRK